MDHILNKSWRTAFCALTFCLIFGAASLFCQTPASAIVEKAPADGAGSGRYFSSDEILLYGVDPNGKEFFLELLLNRKEESERNSFIHYYFASLIYSGINRNMTDSFYDVSREEVAKGIITSFKNTTASDLSSRESLAVGLNVFGKQIDLQIQDLQGDFIIKNKPEYTKYLSVGRANVQIDGLTFAVNAAVTKIYSMDFSKYVFFPGYGELKSVTDYLALWDELGNFYLIDRSRVETDSVGYHSHTWVLFKDQAAGSSSKAFEAEFLVSHKDGEPQSWDIILPSLGRKKIHLEKVVAKEGKAAEGIAKGEVSFGQTTHKISGLFHRHVYN